MIRPSYCRPLQPGDSGTAGDSGPAGGDSGKAPFKVPEDVATLFLAHKMLGVSAYRRFVAGMQLLAIRTFAHPSFNVEEANAGAKMAYEAVTRIAFGKHDERDHDLLTELVGASVAERMISAAGLDLGSSVTVHHIMHTEIIAARMTKDMEATDGKGRPYPTRMFFDVRFLACESVYNSGALTRPTALRLSLANLSSGRPLPLEFAAQQLPCPPRAAVRASLTLVHLPRSQPRRSRAMFPSRHPRGGSREISPGCLKALRILVSLSR